MHISYVRSFLLGILLFSKCLLNAQFMEVEGQLLKINPTGEISTIEIKDDFNFEKHKIIQLKNKLIALDRSSGLVYEIVGDRVIRLDQSYDDKTHNLSLDFVHRDTLFRFGGYGYFKANRNLIYFDFPTRQWDLIKYKNFNSIPDIGSVFSHFIKDDKLYVIGYRSESGTYQNDFEIQRKGFVFDFNTREITETFDLNDDFSPPKCYVESIPGYVFLFYPADRKLLILEKENLNLYTYILNQEQSRIAHVDSHNYVIHGDMIYFKITDIFQNKRVLGMDIQQILDNMVPLDESLFDEPMDRYKWGLFACIFIVVILLVYFKRLRKSSTPLTLEGGNLKYGKVKIKLDPKTERLMELMLEKKTVSNKELNDLFYKKGQNMIHINREKNNCVERINLLFEMKTKRQLILKKQSLYDKRMNVFQLNKKL